MATLFFLKLETAELDLHSAKATGYCDLSKGTIGVTLGGQTFSELIFFKDKERYENFIDGKFAFAANASAVAVAALEVSGATKRARAAAPETTAAIRRRVVAVSRPA